MKIYIRAAVVNVLDEDSDTQSELAYDASTDPDLLDQLADSDDYNVKYGVAQNPNAYESTLIKLANVPSTYIGRYLLNNPNITPRVLDKLADCGDFGIMGMVAENPNTSESTLIKLAHKAVDTDSYKIAIPLAENPNLTEEGLLVLLDYDTHAHAVMDPIIKHPNATLKVMEQLLLEDNGYCGYYDDVSKYHKLPFDFINEFAHSDVEHYRRAVANDPQTPAEILAELVTDDSRWVANDAIANKNLSEEDMWRVFESGNGAVMHNPNCPPEILKSITEAKLNMEGAWGLDTLAKHPNLPVDMLYAIYDSGKDSAYSGIASSPNIPSDLASELSIYEYKWKSSTLHLRKTLAENPNTDPNVLASMVKNSWEVRQALAGNPSTPLKTLTKLSKDKSYRVKEALAHNPNISEEIFDRLLNDGDVSRWDLEKNPTFGERVEW